MPNPRPFAFSAFGCPVQVSATSDTGLDALNQCLFPTFPRTPATEGKNGLHLRLEESGTQFELVVNNVPVARADHAAELVPLAIQHVDETIIRDLTVFRAVHAGAVQFGGGVLLLPGRSHAGKSSLVAELLRRGATYLSDEYALIDGDGYAHPYPRPLLMRSGSPQQTPLLPEECGADVAAGPAPVRWIMELEYRQDAEWKVTPVSQSHGLMILLRHTPHELAESPDLLEKFQRAAVGAQCFCGFRRDAVAAANQILQLVSWPC